MRTLIGFVFLAGMIFLQVYLSRMERRWPGLILPMCSLAYALLVVFSLGFYDAHHGEMLAQVVLVFILTNLPTVVLLAIYFACRSGRRKKDELEKMKLQDLE